MTEHGPKLLTPREAAKAAAQRWSGYTFAVRVSSPDPECRCMVGILVLGHKTDELYRFPLAMGRTFEAALAGAPDRPRGVDLSPLCMVYTDGSVKYADGRPPARFEDAPLAVAAGSAATNIPEPA